jgi:hypothetical protein
LPILELEPANNPAFGLVEPLDGALLIMQAASIAHQGSSGGSSDDFSKRSNAVLPGPANI